MSSADIQKSAAFTYFIMLWSEMTEMTRFPRHCYSVTLMGALHSPVLPADCVTTGNGLKNGVHCGL